MGIVEIAKQRMQPVMWLTLVAYFTMLTPLRSIAQAIDAGMGQVTSSAPAASASTYQESAYTLGSGDRIRIEIFQLPQYSGEHEVQIDGTINLPVASTVSMAGLTLEQAAMAVTRGYQRILRNPVVTVSLLAPRPLQIGIAGEVNRPGTYTLPPGGTQLPTVTQILEAAGGITQAADLRNVEIRRSPQQSRAQVLRIDLWELLQTGDLSYDVNLRDGDTVFVPTATNINLDESLQMASATFASQADQPINIAVIGEVYRPGPYETSGAQGLPTVTQAIQVAGGIKPMADIRQIQVNRPTRQGGTQTIEVDLWKLLQTGDIRQDIVLQEGDTVSIPTVTTLVPNEVSLLAAASFSPNTIRVNLVGEVSRPGNIELSPNTPLNQAILGAGGFNNRARRGSVELVRLNADGSVDRRTIPVDFAEGINEETNPLLRNNDVIIVGRSGLASTADTLGTALSPLGGFFSLFELPFRFLRIFNGLF